MCKYLYLCLIVLTLLTSCSKDEPNDGYLHEPDRSAAAKAEESKVASSLNGIFVGSVHRSSMNMTEVYEYTFTPNVKPYEVEMKWDKLVKKYTIFGECVVKHYYILADNEEFPQSTTEYYYSVRVDYEGAQPELCLFQHNDLLYGISSSHDIRITSTGFDLKINADFVPFVKK